MKKKRFTILAAVYLMLFQDGKILLQRRFNTGWMDGMYSLVAGHVDGDESVINALIREVKEEIGIDMKAIDVVPVTVIHRKSPDQGYIDFFFTAKKWNGTPSISEPNKCDDLRWFSTHALPSTLLPYIKEALNNHKNGVPFSVSGWK